MYYAHENPGFESRSDVRCLNNVVGVMSRQKSEVPMTVGSRDFYPLQKCPDHLRDPPSLQFSGWQGSVPGAKRPGLEVNRLSPSIAEFTHRWNIPLFPLCTFMAWTSKTSTFYHISLKMTGEEEETKNQEKERQITIFNLSDEWKMLNFWCGCYNSRKL